MRALIFSALLSAKTSAFNQSIRRKAWKMTLRNHSKSLFSEISFGVCIAFFYYLLDVMKEQRTDGFDAGYCGSCDVGHAQLYNDTVIYVLSTVPLCEWMKVIKGFLNKRGGLAFRPFHNVF